MDSSEFLEARGKLRASGMLNPSRLAVTPVSMLPTLARHAIKGSEDTLPIKEMTEWLIQEREAAQIVHHSAQTEYVQEWLGNRYKFRMDHVKAQKAGRFCMAQAEVQAVRVARQESQSWLGSSLKKQRTDAGGRKAKDEADRNRWALVSLNVMVKANWVKPLKDLGEAGVERMLVRLRKGMRVRTFKREHNRSAECSDGRM